MGSMTLAVGRVTAVEWRLLICCCCVCFCSVIYCINTSFFRSTCLANMLLFMLKYALLTFRDPRAFVILQQRLRYTPRKETLASLASDAPSGFTPKAGTGFHTYQPPRPRNASVSSNDPSAHRTWDRNRTASISEEL